MSKNERFQEAVTAMTKPENRYDVVIICTTDDHQAAFWMSQLESALRTPEDSGDFPVVLAVSEDWGGSGAGNGLGTLYAWKKACAYAKDHKDLDLPALLGEGKISAALFHTAGKGTRMAPLPASENNNKPGVKLPFVNATTGKPITVLESVVQQTGIYAPSRKGRLSVYWGDQVFLPSVEFTYTPTHHVDIMCTLLGDSAPTAEEWSAQGLEKYGVIAVLEGGEAAQVEKVDHATATQMLGELGTMKQVGPSLGSFSVSASILAALVDEYKTELAEKTAKLDTDPHFWMPMTLSKDAYVRLMKQKDIEEEISKAHHDRMTAFAQKFDRGTLSGLFGAVDVGKDACWWDYGQLKLYSQNTRLLLDDANPESALLRQFLRLEHGPVSGTGDLTMNHAYAFASKLAKGTVKDSLVCQVSTKEIEADGAIVVNCVAPKITAAPGAILYNIMSEEPVVAEANQVMVAVTEESGESFVLKSSMTIDGGKAWKEVVEGNELSFEQVHKNNKEANITQIAEARAKRFESLAASF
eukprot:Nitzschia sp. Nitz4//scaffold225_size51843//24519//26223//NITZ4_006897-RA/size51843-processed-gene-0.60-mRNA-1//1//CDS//3329542681//1153//frame0